MRFLLIVLVALSVPSAFAQEIDLDHSIDGGVFLFLAVISLLCFLFAFKFSTALIIITIVILFIFSTMMFGNYDVTFVSTTLVGSDSFTTTNCVICQNHHFAGYVFSALAVLTALIFLRIQVKGDSYR